MTTGKTESFEEAMERGNALWAQGAAREALRYFQQATRAVPSAFWPRYLAGLSYEVIGRPAEAVAAHREALDLAPEHADAWRATEALERLQQRFGDLDTPYAPASQSVREEGRRGLVLFEPLPDEEWELTLKHSTDPHDQLPVPPAELMEYGEAPERHLETGREIVDSMVAALGSCGFEWSGCETALEFGCSNGRLIRWLADYAAEREIWGVDVQSDKVKWAMEHLDPPFKFAVTTVAPHLPFEDRSLDLIYAGSVFTHIGELHVAWLLELARVLSNRGFLYLTLHDEHAAEALERGEASFFGDHLRKTALAPQIFSGEFDFLSVSPYGNTMLSQIFMSSDYLRRTVRPFLEVVDVFPGAYGFQTGFVLKRGRPPRRARAHTGGSRRPRG